MVPRHADGPPPGRTGGFGESTCSECHRRGPIGDSTGSLTIDSLPASYQPDREYRLTVLLTRPGMMVGGFQLAVRTNDGSARQAGYLASTDDRSMVVTQWLGPIQYLQHTRTGTALTGSDSARWTFIWRAPDGAGPVAFHVAANAANDDNSELGDVVYTREFILPAVR